MKKVILFLMATSLFVAACSSDKENSSDKKETMSPVSKDAMSSASEKAEKNKKTALASAMAVSSHDLDAMFKDAAADGVDYGDGSMAPMKGVDSIKAAVKAWMNAFPDVKGENLEAFSNSDGSKVIVVGEWSATFKNDFMGMKATNKSYKIWDGDVFTFNEEGKITSHRAIQSGMTSMMQVGAMMK